MDKQDQRSVAEIYQDNLDEASGAMSRHDMTAALDCFCLPCHIKTLNLELTIETLQELEEAIVRFIASQRDQGVSRVIRIVKEAEFVGDDEIRGLHETHQFFGNTWRMTPYRNRNRLKRGADGKWRISHIAAALLNRSGHVQLVESPQNPADVPDFGDM